MLQNYLFYLCFVTITLVILLEISSKKNFKKNCYKLDLFLYPHFCTFTTSVIFMLTFIFRRHCNKSS